MSWTAWRPAAVLAHRPPRMGERILIERNTLSFDITINFIYD